jgi:hypothetical protein
MSNGGYITARQEDNCTPATCPNGKCNQTGECIEQVAQEMRALGSYFAPRVTYDDEVTAEQIAKLDDMVRAEFETGGWVESPPLVPNATTIAAIEELERGGGTTVNEESERCPGCDGYSCDNGCAFPGAVSPPRVSRQRLIDADSATRKTYPMARGLLDYFPDALAAVAQVSHIGNEKHNPGEPMHHARGKSMDHADCILRHLVGRGGFDGDTRESAALAWRALALLQEELESEMGLPLPRGARAG